MSERRPGPAWAGVRRLGLLALAAIALAPAPVAAQAAPPQTGGRRDRELVARALDLFQQGDCAAAEPLLTEVLGRQPKDVAVRKLLGRCLLKDRNWEEARVHFQRVLDLAPQDSAALEGLRAAVAEIQKQEQLRQTLAIDSRHATEEQLRDSHAFQEAEELLAAKKLAEAEAILAAVARRNPQSAPAQERLAEIYSTTKRFGEAVAIYRTLAARPGATSLYLLRLGQNLEWSASWEEARAAYLALLKDKPDDPDGRLGLANTLAMTEHCQEAVTEFGRVLALRPKDLDARLGQARCYDRLGQAEQAHEAYQKVLELDAKSPAALQARARYQQVFDEQLKRKGYEAAEHGDFEAAAAAFERYLEKHGDSTEALLQAARAWSWAKRVPEAQRRYQEYLGRVPGDQVARRELAKTELWGKAYPAARQHFLELVRGPAATTEDYEGLVHAFTWGGDLEGAEPHALKLAELAPGNAVAQQALAELRERRRLEARDAADALLAAGRLQEAGDAYRRYRDTFGKDQKIELQICRIWSATKDYLAAVRAFRNYLREYPGDTSARVELANNLSWARKYAEAEAEYRAILGGEPANVPALLGLAQVKDYRGDDRIEVVKGYEKVLSVDPANDAARQKRDEIHAEVATAISWNERGFSDTDGLRRSVSSMEVAFALNGRVKLIPFYAFSYFHQDRLVPGSTPEIAALNRATEARGGTTLSHQGGARLTASTASGWSVLAEAALVHFDSGESSVNGRGQLYYRTPSDRTGVVMEYVRREAVHDVDTAASLVAGVMGDTAAMAWRQSLPLKLRFWTSAGISRYSEGTDPRFESDTQRRFGARLELAFSPSNRFGYFYRYSSFDHTSPLYFSPASYQTHGAILTLGREPSKRLRLALDADGGWSRIDGTSNIEVSVRPSLRWKITPSLPLTAAYRYARSRTSLFGSGTYGAQTLELSLARSF